jgi:hypothetical protein
LIIHGCPEGLAIIKYLIQQIDVKQPEDELSPADVEQNAATWETRQKVADLSMKAIQLIQDGDMAGAAAAYREAGKLLPIAVEHLVATTMPPQPATAASTLPSYGGCCTPASHVTFGSARAIDPCEVPSPGKDSNEPAPEQSNSPLWEFVSDVVSWFLPRNDADLALGAMVGASVGQAKPAQVDAEEAKLQQFWHDYYASQAEYYRSLAEINWVAYYKNHGYIINPGEAGITRYAPMFAVAGVSSMPSSSVFAPTNVPSFPFDARFLNQPWGPAGYYNYPYYYGYRPCGGCGGYCYPGASLPPLCPPPAMESPYSPQYSPLPAPQVAADQGEQFSVRVPGGPELRANIGTPKSGEEFLVRQHEKLMEAHRRYHAAVQERRACSAKMAACCAAIHGGKNVSANDFQICSTELADAMRKCEDAVTMYTETVRAFGSVPGSASADESASGFAATRSEQQELSHWPTGIPDMAYPKKDSAPCHPSTYPPYYSPIPIGAQSSTAPLAPPDSKLPSLPSVQTETSAPQDQKPAETPEAPQSSTPPPSEEPAPPATATTPDYHQQYPSCPYLNGQYCPYSHGYYPSMPESTTQTPIPEAQLSPPLPDVDASAAKSNDIHVLKSRVFHFPIHVDPALVSKLREVTLYMRDGQSAWEHVETVDPTATSIRCRVTHDGEFSFQIVTVDLQGRPSLKDLDVVAPAMTIVVDTSAVEASSPSQTEKERPQGETPPPESPPAANEEPSQQPETPMPETTMPGDYHHQGCPYMNGHYCRPFQYQNSPTPAPESQETQPAPTETQADDQPIRPAQYETTPATSPAEPNLPWTERVRRFLLRILSAEQTLGSDLRADGAD